MKAALHKGLTILCLGGFLFSLYEVSGFFLDSYAVRRAAAEAADLYAFNGQVEPSVQEEPHAPDRIRKRLDKLLKINPDIVGWIRIDDTSINDPIVQTEDNDTYLYLNYKREYAKAGSIFMDFRNEASSLQRNTVIYGHRMKDGSMFGDLKKYLDADFYEKHRRISIDTLYESYDAEIFSVYVTTTDFDYIQTEFVSREAYAAFLSNVQKRSLYDTSIEVTADNSIVTLSTCDYTLDPSKGRLAIHAKLIKKEGE